MEYKYYGIITFLCAMLVVSIVGISTFINAGVEATTLRTLADKVKSKILEPFMSDPKGTAARGNHLTSRVVAAEAWLQSAQTQVAAAQTQITRINNELTDATDSAGLREVYGTIYIGGFTIDGTSPDQLVISAPIGRPGAPSVPVMVLQETWPNVTLPGGDIVTYAVTSTRDGPAVWTAEGASVDISSGSTPVYTAST